MKVLIVIATVKNIFQSNRSAIYAQYFDQLENKDLFILASATEQNSIFAEAPHLSDGRVIYAGTCRHLSSAERLEKAKQRCPAYRVAVGDAKISFTDAHYGKQSYHLATKAAILLSAVVMVFMLTSLP